ncbi:MAG: transcription-repair coupling factor [Pirellulales bacterium]
MTEATPDRLRLLNLAAEAKQAECWSAVRAALAEGRSASMDGVWGSSAALAVGILGQLQTSGRIVLITAHPNELDDWADEISFFAGAQPLVFPAAQGGGSVDARPDPSIGQRLRALKDLQLTQSARPAERRRAAEEAELRRPVVTCVQALLQPVAPPGDMLAGSRQVAVGDQLDGEKLAPWLVEHGFHPTTAVELPGEFSPRGGILDVFPVDGQHPVRIELFDDQIESIRVFDVGTQRSLESLRSITITTWRTSGATAGWLFDYLPSGTWWMALEPAQLDREAHQFAERHEDGQLHRVAAFWRKLQERPTLHAASLLSGTESTHVVWPVESVERFSGKVAQLRDEVQQIGSDRDFFVVCQTESESTRLRELLIDTDLWKNDRLHFPLGRMRHGFRLSVPPAVLVGETELFHRTTVRRAPVQVASKAIDSFLDLRSGDLVVHLAHGIARYRGIELIDKGGHVEEHLALEFEGGTRIYVPVSKIDLVQKYVGGRKSRPRLATLGSKSWVRQKAAATQAAADVAAEMLELHARRQGQSGIRFAPDSTWQHEFDAAFPYQETDDQLRAIDALKADMENSRPMDRLICGDVGFGKTEVAMRAAFKAVDNGFQVAVLVPTTILAEQHFLTFTQRMAEFPFTIAKLSRFSTAGEQRMTVESLAKGGVDIVIGTHRLASADVRFHNLGLLIIDEEQRFGVEVKDRLKLMRSNVDVLTLSATPIPRTLHMSLTGIRDISNLETPPEDRMAVETKVTRWNATLIRTAILRELDREGQVYFVHNVVQDIHTVARKLREIVPEARLGIGHGQMGEHELEQVMTDFVAHKFDVLLATTIIESGLDIPNANTIFVDQANRYGLADLHQLRGRVGRYKHRAYCYLMLDPNQILTPSAARRLRAIEEYSDMGAGFAIAMRDLEIRGAGDLLGTQQSGHIATVGYELYCQLLEAAVRRLRNQPAQLAPEVDIQLPGESYLPPEYVPDMRAKIDIYRRLARSYTDEELAQLESELADRFGPLPSAVQRMLRLARLKTDAAIWQIHGIHWESPYVVFSYGDRGRAEQLVRQRGRLFRLVDDEHIYVPTTGLVDLTADGWPDRLIDFIRSSLQP